MVNHGLESLTLA